MGAIMLRTFDYLTTTLSTVHSSQWVSALCTSGSQDKDTCVTTDLRKGTFGKLRFATILNKIYIIVKNN